MLNTGVPYDSITPLLATARKAERANLVEEVEEQNGKDRKRCKWWNRGYCREKTGAPTATQLVTVLITCREGALGAAVPPLDTEKSVNIF